MRIFFDGIFLVEILGEIFWVEFLRGYFWEDFWEDFFGRNSTKSFLNIEGIDLFVKIWVFVKILGKGRGKFKSLEVRLQAHRT